MRGKKSKYEEHFELAKDKATCKKCGEVIRRRGSTTTGMQYHLASQHSIKASEKSEPEAGPAPKKSKIDDSCSSSTSKGPLDQYVTVKSKIPLEDLVAREAVKGATFRYLASSYLIKKGLCALGFQDEAPNHHTSVSKLVDKSAENHRAKLCEHLKNLAEKGQKFCAITDEWTCPGKKKRYINVSLHLKGNFRSIFYVKSIVVQLHSTVWKLQEFSLPEFSGVLEV